ncbi:MAG: carbonic anhydrase family protein [Rubrivivax sp.]|nr:carbonic anhydrase family protein [Rubrivivax sp.]
MERLRRRLAERLATPGAAARSGTIDLQVGTRPAAAAPSAATGPGAKPGAPFAAGPGVPGHGISAEDIGRGDAEGIAWSRPSAARAAAAAAPTHRAVAAAAASPLDHGAVSALALPPQRQTARAAPAAKANGGHGGHGATGAPHWGYEGAAGPASWGALKPEFSLCSSGQRQSPIDIRGGLAVDLDPVRFDYKAGAFAVIDNGHTVQVNVAPGSSAIEVGGRRYDLVQFHFHRPSEERIDGRQFEMSLHLVHKDANGRLAVVAVLLGKGPAHPAVQAVWNNLPLERNEEAAARTPLDPAELLPEDRRYYTYMGSLTTPPCTEGVLWVVMRTPVTVTAAQVDLFARIYPMNARPPQALAGRRIMQSQ